MRDSGFTLVELLVVISILALVMALLFPVLSGAREQAKAVSCAAREKNIMTALITYERERGEFPRGFHFTQKEPPAGYIGNYTVDLPGWHWYDFISLLNDDSWQEKNKLRCPAKRLDDDRLEADVLCGNYGVNLSICKGDSDFGPYRKEFVGTPLSSTDVPTPSSTLLLVDSGYTLIGWWHAAEEPPVKFGNTIQDTAYIPGLETNENRQLWPGQTRDAKRGRHPNKTVNVVFVDGHIARKQARELLVEKTGEDEYDKSPVWVPQWPSTPTSVP